MTNIYATITIITKHIVLGLPSDLGFGYIYIFINHITGRRLLSNKMEIW